MKGIMKAAIMREPGEIHLEDRPIPELDYGETLIKVRYIGICGSDVHLLHGKNSSAIYPLLPGHEFVGEVVESKGEGSERLKIGDIVAAQELISCGICEACAKGEDNVCKHLKIIGIHTDGGFAEYVKVKTRKVFVLPKDIDLKVAALIEPFAVAVHDVRRSELKIGETAYIAGGGPIGLLIGIAARLAGARKIVVSEVMEGRLALARKLGFDTVNPTLESFDDDVKVLGEGRGFDVSFETAGVQQSMDACIEHTKNTGRIIVLATPTVFPVLDTSKVFMKELSLLGVRVNAQYSFMGSVDIVTSGMVDDQLKLLIDNEYTLDEIEKAFKEAETNKNAFKILVKVS
jgi:2-desacetyl-2-hydroxyethyl bacteriochlorophyllide A dehydrogenase